MKNTTNANAWTFTRNSITVNGQTFPASYSLARGGDVYVFTTLRVADGTDMPIRIHVGQDMPMHAEAVAAAKPAEAPAPVQEAPIPAQDKPTPVQEAPAKKPSRKATKKADKPAKASAPVQDKPASVREAPAKKADKPVEAPAPVQEAPANKPAPVDKPWIGTTITGKGWNIAFDEQTQRTRVLFQTQPTDAQKAAIESAGFYWSAQLQSWNKKLTCKAYRAAQTLAAALNALA